MADKLSIEFRKHRRFLPRLVWTWAAAIFSALAAVSMHGSAIAQFSAQAVEASTAPSFLEMQQKVAAASKQNPVWDGPRDGPPGVTEKTIAIIAEDMRNGGILGVAQGVYEAAKVLNWNVKVFDAAGTPQGRDKAAADALASQPDGLIIIGAGAKDMEARLKRFTDRGTPVVGWHVGPVAGRLENSLVAVNISTDPLEVARITAMASVVASGGRANVVIFTDSNFEIAMAKANAMAAVIRACPGCTLLELRDVAISKSAETMPQVTRDLLARYGSRWTHALAINDIYFDYATPELNKAELSGNSINLLSAGDGSAAAFMRIQARIYQTGTVAEPLNMHGWQLIDELNRLLARQPVTGYVAPVHLVTSENVAFDGGTRFQYDPDNGYRDIYRHIWKR